ncbi:MAG: nitrate ABC transporter substrate-binding protein [Planctomycetes bacterium]|nr:nitrate ABC transporter substrate-binding protein [Planctomycetota bacterium]
MFDSKRYSEFATMSEDLGSGTLSAAFINAPLAMSLHAKGVPIKIVYLGHRDGTTLMVGANSGITSFAQLKGKKILIPSAFSNQKLWIARLCKQYGIALSDLDLRVAPPPEMPSLLETGSCDAYAVGEPHAARAEMAGTGRVLLHVKDSWPNFISCVLVVREDLMAQSSSIVQELVDGIAGSGLWLEQSVENRLSAAQVAGKYYYNQKPELVQFVMQKPVDRVRYENLAPAKADFEEIMDLALETGMFTQRMRFEEYCDTRFSESFGGEMLPMPPDDGLGKVGGVKVVPPKPAASQPASAPAAPAGGGNK